MVQPNVSPNGMPGVDAAISVFAHELAETVTDPQMDGWFYTTDAGDMVETGDQCAWDFPNYNTLDNGANYNVVVNNQMYYIQSIWNLNTQTCAMS